MTVDVGTARVQNPARRGRPPVLSDFVLDEWVAFDGPTGGIDFDRFARNVGMSVEGWHRMFYRARHDGDRRAVRPKREPQAERSGAELLAEWARLGGPSGLISSPAFAERYGLAFEGWRSTLRRARRAGDSRAASRRGAQEVR